MIDVEHPTRKLASNFRIKQSRSFCKILCGLFSNQISDNFSQHSKYLNIDFASAQIKRFVLVISHGIPTTCARSPLSKRWPLCPYATVTKRILYHDTSPEPVFSKMRRNW